MAHDKAVEILEQIAQKIEERKIQEAMTVRLDEFNPSESAQIHAWIHTGQYQAYTQMGMMIKDLVHQHGESYGH